MKRSILILGGLMLAFNGFSQTRVGGKVGLNYTIITTMVDPEPDEKPENGSGIGFHLGGYVQFGLSEMIGLRPELLFSARGFQESNTSTSTYDVFGVTYTDESKSDNKSSYNYLEIPVLLVLQPNDNIGLHIGPGFGLLMGGKVKSSGSTTTSYTSGGSTTTTTSDFDVEVSGSDVTDGLRKMELAVVIGGDYETDGGLNFGLRYWRGLNTVNEDTEFGDTTVKSFTNLIQFSIGFSFIKG